MRKFFIVGKKCLILGTEKKDNIFHFSIGKTLLDQKKFIDLKIKEDNIFIENKFKKKYPLLIDGFNIILKTLNKNFKNFSLLDSSGSSYNFQLGEQVTINNKYPKLTDVYNNPDMVPWNFMPTEIEDILSYFDKNILKNKKILYIGAGYGKNLWAINYKKYHIDSIEYSDKAVNRANKIFHKKIIKKQDLLTLSDTDKYDLVLDIGCLHSLPKKNLSRAINIVYTSLKPNGMLISRIFKARSQEWLKKMPFKTKAFGLTKDQINKLLKNKFEFENKFEHEDYLIIGAKKC